MSSPSISSLGVGSGLDLGSLLDSLKSSEQTRLQPLQSQKTSYTAKLSGYGVLTGAVKDLQSAADKLNDPSLFDSTKVAVTGDAISASSSDEAVPGRYDVSVSQLAQAQSLVASPVADKTANIGSGGTISIATGNSDPLTVSLSDGNSSLADVRDAINNADAGVSASIINDGTDTPYRLVLSADASGTDNQINVTVANNSSLSGLIDYNSSTQNLEETVPAQDAKLSVNGIAISRDSNTVSGAIQGVTLTLNSTTTAASTNKVSVTRDNDTVKGAIKSFVSAYNNYQGKADALTAFNGPDSSSRNGILLGDSTARSVSSQLNKALNTPVTGNSLSVLSDVGISLQTDGTLKIADEGKLDGALSDDPRGVAALFSGDPTGTADDDGVAGTLSATIGRITDDNGLLSSASDGIQNSIDGIDDRISDMQSSIDDTIDRYRKQFVQLDSLISDLNSTQSYLTTQLSKLNGPSQSQ